MTSFKKEFQNPEKIGYLPSLDGIRAIAVLMVMFAHAHFQLGKNGALGVDVFFALSGFLITTLLLEEKHYFNMISLPNFYLRRFFRLFPALYILLFVVLVYSLTFAAKAENYIIVREVYAAGLYLYNVSWAWGWGTGSVFLGHTWSLAVEEQFYFIWPMVVILSFRFFSLKKLQIGLILFIVIVWFLKLIFQLPIVSSLVFESLFIGCSFALLRWTGNLPEKITGIALISFILLLILGFFPIPHFQNMLARSLAHWRFIGGLLTMLVVIGLLNNPTSRMETLLSSRILVAIGKISYALYLWHLPVFRWFSMYSAMPSSVTFALKFIVTFLLASISWIFIEKKSVAYGKRFKKV